MRLKVLIHSNYSALRTGFGKVMRYVLTGLYKDQDIELIEAANGVPFGNDPKRPWAAYGTMNADATFLSSIQGDEFKKRANLYGYYKIDEIVEKVKPDLYIGLEDPWAFSGYADKKWFREIPTIIWSPLDSLPITQIANELAAISDKFLTCATFASKAMNSAGFDSVECLHQPIDVTNFFPMENRAEIRRRHGIGMDNFVIGFVFKNQLRKSVFSLLGAFREFQKRNNNKGRLILHTDWSENQIGTSWDIPSFLKEYNVDPSHVFATYRCKACGEYFLRPYSGEDLDCPSCNTPKVLATKTSAFGVTEEQLNEIYNCMDVYCHPFTSGGQELPLQESKAAGLITLVNDYSCGSDASEEEQGGMALDWVEYKEPHTGFSKAAVSQESILKNLERVYKFSPAARQMYGKYGREYILKNYQFDVVIPKLKQIILDTAKNSKKKKQESTQEVVAIPSFEDLLDKEGKQNRMAVVIPESAGDVLMVNSLLSNLKELYPDKNLYVITKDSFMAMIDDHPAIHKILPFQDGIDNLLYLEGQWEHAGFFSIAFLPHIITQKYFGYHHNGLTKYQFELKE